MILKKDLRDIFKKNLRFYRLKNNMTQEDLADKVGLTDKYISDLERGLFVPRFEKLADIAETLNIEAYKLIKDENNTSDLTCRYTKTNKKQILLDIK